MHVLIQGKVLTGEVS